MLSCILPISLVEEIATVRYMLRNVLGLALGTQEVPVYIRLVEIYGSGCVRLVRMLEKEESDQSQLRSYLEQGMDQAFMKYFRSVGGNCDYWVKASMILPKIRGQVHPLPKDR